MTRRAKAEHASGYIVLLVDDNPDYLQATRLLLEREGHHVLSATNGAEALAILPQQKIDLLLLDYFMPGMTGEQVVSEVRKVDPFVQVILQTGYASEQPPRELLHRLNIQGYYDKTEGPEQLLLWTAVGLKAACTLQLLYKTRHGIEFILERTPDLHRLQSTTELSVEILQQTTTLLSEIGPFSDVSGFLATLDAEANLVVSAATGVFAGAGKAAAVVGPDRVAAIEAALEAAQVRIGPLGTIVPLRAGPLTVGVIYLDQAIAGDQALALVRLLANQAAVALQNAQLYEIASIDLLTETHTRAAFDRALLQELSASSRAGQSVGLVVVDVDQMKAVNERVGHVAGDQALRGLGHILSQLSRAGDVVARFEKDAFAVLLRDPTTVGPARLADRVQDLMKDRKVAGPDGEVSFRVSIGFSLVEPRGLSEGAPKQLGPQYFQSVARSMIESVLAALREAQRAGGGTVRGSPPIAWPG